MEVNDVILMIVKVIVAVAATLITTYVVPALKAYVESHKESQLFGVIETAVRAAEQTVTGSGEGAAKKQQVELSVLKWAKEKGIDIDSKQLNQIIEECVYLLNQTK